MTSVERRSVEAKRKTLGGFQFLTLAIGCMIGVGWITVVGEWLGRAGPIGTIAGFLLGGVVMAGVAACYAELSSMMPQSGGDVVFAERVFSRDVAFLVGWFLVLMAGSVAAFEAISFVWVATTLAPWLGATPLYSVFGEDVTVQGVVLGVALIALIYTLNRVGTSASATLQDFITVLKLVIIAAFVVLAVAHGDVAALGRPAGSSGNSALLGSFWIAATCPFWLGGFQVISQAAGDRRPGTSLKLVGIITTSSVFIGVLFYIAVAVAVTMAAPLSEIINTTLPAAAAAEAVFESKMGAAAVLIAGLFGITATLNAMFVSGSRLSLALGELKFFPNSFAKYDYRGAPYAGLNLVAVMAFLGVIAGKGALLPVVDTASISLIVSYLLVCAAVLRLRVIKPAAKRPFAVPGGRSAVVATTSAVTAMAVFIIAQPAIAGHTFPLEWILFISWGALGTSIWILRRRQSNPASELGE